MNEGGLSRLYSFKTSEDAGLQSEMGHYEALDALLASQSRDPGGRPLVGSTWEVTVALKRTKQQTSIGDGMIATKRSAGGSLFFVRFQDVNIVAAVPRDSILMRYACVPVSDTPPQRQKENALQRHTHVVS